MPTLGHVIVSVQDSPVLPTLMVSEEADEEAVEAEEEVSVPSGILAQDWVSHSVSILQDSVSLVQLHRISKQVRAMER